MTCREMRDLRDHTYRQRKHRTNSLMCSVIDHGHFAFPSLFIGATFYFIKGIIQRHCLKDLFIAPLIMSILRYTEALVFPHMQFLVLLSGASEREIPVTGTCMFAFSMNTSWLLWPMCGTPIWENEE